MENKRVIKNATLQDLESLRGETIIASPMSNVENNISANETIKLKPKTSSFEPDPVQFYLPSGSHFIEEGYIWIRRLSTAEEGTLLKLSSEKDFNNAINKIFESSIKSDISISSIPLIDKVPIFITIIALTYGGNISINDVIKDDCKTCRDDERVYIDILKDIKIKQLDDSIEYPLSIITDDEKYIIKYRYPTIKDEAGSEESPLDFIKKIIIEIKEVNSNLVIDKKSASEMIQWLTPNEKKKISVSLSEISKHGNSFECTIGSCSNKNCSMKDQKISLSSDNLLTRVVNSIVENLAI